MPGKGHIIDPVAKSHKEISVAINDQKTTELPKTSPAGELDAEQLFYLRSRGIPDAEAREMLVRAFLAEALDGVTHDAVRAALEAGVERWWEKQAA